ncbi:asparagine synthetase B family protein [Microbacterium protaetiae]|uniref:Asparagine synthetase B family protein n=1 Tax=Microbacterium protaetiae TaxID=2509458 RepID=A0A4P6ERR1_9MICO|nr:asparagine synthetase B family protein [Microbacterium protaetiae]QAY60608.1 asparagine synthetase B family protein [Microbacterium protaetiae]
MTAPTVPGERFVAQPFVCGAFGEDEDHLFDRLLASSPAPVTMLHDSRDIRFAASRSDGLETVPDGWVWGRYVARNTRPRTAQHASEDIGLAGFWVDSNSKGATLHTDWLGTQDIFTRAIGGTTFWANRMSPLIEFADVPVHADIMAWRTYFVLSGFSAGSTPMVEISRLDAGQRLDHVAGETRLSTRLPRWFTDPSGTATVNDLAAAIVAAVPQPAARSVDLTLSGGLDSRLLLAALLTPNALPVSWSTHHENGWDGDIRIAGEIARAIGIEHHVVDYQTEDWLAAREPTLVRLEHATCMHNWMMPLAQVLRNQHASSSLFDGLAGDVLMRYHDNVASSASEQHAREVWSALGARPFQDSRVLRQSIRDEWEAEAFADWRARSRSWDDHPYAETVMRLLTRTRRAIAVSPFRLFSPERRVLTPFIDPEVVRTVCAVPPLPRQNRDLRPAVLRILNPVLADIDSTVNPHRSQVVFTERGPTSAAAARSMSQSIVAEPAVARLFDMRRIESLATNSDGDRLPRAVRNGAALAHWISHWRGRLAELPRFD